MRLDLLLAAKTKAPKLSLNLVDIISMKLRGSNPEAIIGPAIAASMSGVEVDLKIFEAHFLAGGQLDRIVPAMILAHSKGMEISFNQLAAEDFSGRDPMELIQK